MSDDADWPPPGQDSIPVSELSPAIRATRDTNAHHETAQPPHLHDAASPSAGTTSWLVRSADLASMRRHLLGAAALAGLSRERAERFTLAVNEIVINAIRHAGGLATVDVASTEPTGERTGQITVTVTDTGPGFNADMTPRLPPADQIHGRGLWLVGRLCDDVEINSSPYGPVVRLRAAAQRT